MGLNKFHPSGQWKWEKDTYYWTPPLVDGGSKGPRLYICLSGMTTVYPYNKITGCLFVCTEGSCQPLNQSGSL